MASRFTIRNVSNNTTVYTFPVVQDTNLPKNPRDTVTKTSLRSKGAVVIDGGTKPFNATLFFILFAESGEYHDVMDLIDTLEAAIPINTPLYLRMDKGNGNYADYKIKRLVDFDYPDVSTDLRNYRQKVNATFLANAW